MGSRLYFVNVPIRRENAWIFPVGLSDGLWFIYRDPKQKVILASDVSDAHRDAVDYPEKSYIFYFDDKYMIHYFQ